MFAESRLPSIYGGEYEELASLVTQICRAWLTLGLAPTFVFDGKLRFSLLHVWKMLSLIAIIGPVLAEKIEEVARRYQEALVEPSVLFYRTSPAGRSTTSFQNRISMVPPLIFPACLDALSSMKNEGVECFFADGEADPECAGLAAHYGGYVLAQDSDYLIFNAAHKGYITLDDLVWAVPSASDALDMQNEDDGFQTVSRAKKRAPPEPTGITRGLIPPADFLSLTVTIYHPETLAASLKLGTGLLPLVATCLGCDFTPPTFAFNFFPKNMPVAERVRRVAAIIGAILYPSRNPLKRRGPRSRLLKAAQGADKVTQLISAVVTDLAIRDDLGERELGALVETMRDSIFHYIVPDDFPGPGPLSDTDLVQPANEDQRKVQRRFLKAYRRGEFSQKLMGYYATGTAWPRPALEDPDVKTSQDVVGGPVRQWTYAVLAHGLDGLGREDAVERPPAEEEDDEDELVDVEEELTDSEDEQNAYQMVGDPSAPMSPTSTMGGSIEDLSFDPLVLLRNQLEGLRGQQPVGVLPPNGSSHTTNGTDLGDSTISLQSVPEPVRPSGPRFVIEYMRRATRLVPVKVPVPDLGKLIAAAEKDEDAKSRGDTLPPIEFTTPIQLQPSSTRLALFLYTLYANTSPIRELPPHWIVLAASLRWTIIASSMGHPSKAKGVFRGTWTRSEVKALIASCSLSSSDGQVEGIDRIMAPIIPASLDPAELSTRSIQLSSLIFAALENSIEYAQALLLKEETLPTSRVSRAISGKRFHWLVGRLSSSRELFERDFGGLYDIDGGREDVSGLSGEKDAVFRAVLDGLDAHLAEESWQRPARVKKPKATPQKDVNPLKSVPVKGKGAVAGKFDILALLQSE